MKLSAQQNNYRGEIDKLDKAIDRAEKTLEREESILEKHQASLEKKSTQFTLYDALIEEDKDEAGKLWSDNKLGITEERHRKKTEVIERIKVKILAMKELRDLMKSEIESLFDPYESQYAEVKDEFRKATNEDWKRIPNSLWKTFQDIFAPPGYRTVPRDAGIFDGAEHDNIPLDSCVIDPDPKRSAARFAKEFGLTEMSGDATPFQQMQTILEAKPEIANAFGHLKPMSPYGPEGEADSYRLLVFRDYEPEHNGKIVAPIFLGRTSRIQDRKVFQIFDSSYKAHRKSLHANRSYETEAPKIFGLQVRIKSLNTQTQGLKKDDPKIKVICEQLEREVLILENATNHFKAEAGDILKAVAGIKDSIGRHNAGKACAQMIAVLNRLSKRMPQIHEKSKAMGEDEKVLSMRIDRAEAILDLCFSEFRTICSSTEQYEKRNGDGPLFQGYDDLKNNVNNALSVLSDLDALTIRPFNLYAEKFKEKAEEIKEALEKRDVDALRDSSIKAFIISKIFKVQQERERILKEITLLPDDTMIEVLVKYAEELLEVVTDRQVYPFVVTSYKFQYSDIQKRVGKLVVGLKFHIGRGLDTEEKREERRGMYGRLKGYLEEINFPEILEELD